MSQERFDWLAPWVSAPDDIVRTPGTESNVKEIYDTCAELARDPANEIVNQFSEFGNYLGALALHRPGAGEGLLGAAQEVTNLQLAGFVSASGSAGTLAAGDYLKAKHGTRIAVVEAVECPTLLMNGYGEHNIQGIGDKHVPLIHNVMNTDLVIGVSDQATDGLNAVFNTDDGRAYLARRLGVAPTLLAALDRFGLSSIANVLGAIKMAKHLDLGPDDVIVTVATDGHEMYASELARYLQRRHNSGELTPRWPPSSSAGTCSAPTPSTCSTPPSASASASSISATSPGSSSRASRSPISTGAEPGLLARPAGPAAAMGRDDHRLQPRQRHGRGCMRPIRGERRGA